GEDLDEWETLLPDEGIRLVGRAGLAVEDADRRPELRLLRIGGRAPDAGDPLGSPEARFALLRARDWLAGRSVRLVHADLLYGGMVDLEVHADSVRAELRLWVGRRLEAVRRRIADPLPRPRLACGRCPVVAGGTAPGC